MLLDTQCMGRQARFGIRASGSEIQGVNHDSSPLQVSQTLLTEHFLQRNKAATGNGEASRLSLSLTLPETKHQRYVTGQSHLGN